MPNIKKVDRELSITRKRCSKKLFLDKYEEGDYYGHIPWGGMVNKDQGWVVTFVDEQGGKKHETWETGPPWGRSNTIQRRQEDDSRI
jgi:hypothetical protein